MTPAQHRLTGAPLLCELLDRPVAVVMSTVSPSGRPQASVVWVERRGDELALFCERDSAKGRNLAVNPHVSILVVDHDRLLRAGVPAYAQISGTAELSPEEEGQVDGLARAYGWSDGYTLPRGECYTVHITVSRVTGYGPGDTKSMGGWGHDD